MLDQKIIVVLHLAHFDHLIGFVSHFYREKAIVARLVWCDSINADVLERTIK